MKIKRLLAAMLVLCMVIALLPTAALADGGGDTANQASDVDANAVLMVDEDEGEPSPAEVAEGSVASIGSTGYATLAEAITAAQSGDTVTLLDSVTTDSYLVIPANKKLTLDLGGHTLSLSGYAIGDKVYSDDSKTTVKVNLIAFLINYGDLTLKNGIITDTVTAAGSYEILNTGTLTLESNLTIDAPCRGGVANHDGTLTSQATIKATTSVACSAIDAFGGTVNVTGGSLSGYQGVIVYNKYYNSAVGNGEANVNISNATITCYTYGIGTNNVLSDGSCVTVTDTTIAATRVGIFWPSAGTLILGTDEKNGPTVTGWTPVEVSCGTLTINSGTYTSNLPADAAKNYNAPFQSEKFLTRGTGSVGLCDALTIFANRSSTAGEGYDQAQMTVTINGGTFTAPYGYGIRYLDYNKGTAVTLKYTPKVTITGGSFTGNSAAVDFGTDTKNVTTGCITSGTFSSDVSDYCAEGLAAAKNSAGQYVVSKKQTVTTITADSTTAIKVTTTKTEGGSETTSTTVKEAGTAVQNALNQVTTNTAVTDYATTSVAEATGDDNAYIKTEPTAVTVDESNKVTSITYDVKPVKDNVDGNAEAIGTEFKKEITFRLAVPDSFDNQVQVSHKHGETTDSMGFYNVKGENGAKYIELESKKFSEFTLANVAPDSDEYKSLVASVGDKAYDDIQEAITAALASGETLIMMKAFDSETPVTVQTDISDPVLKVNYGDGGIYPISIVLVNAAGQAIGDIQAVDNTNLQVKATVSKIEANADEEVTVTISVEGHDYYGANIEFTVDPSMLDLQNVVDKDGNVTVTNHEGWTYNNGTFKYSKVYGKDDAAISAGTIGTFTFKVLKQSTDGAVTNIAITKSNVTADTAQAGSASATPRPATDTSVTINKKVIVVPTIANQTYNGTELTAAINNAEDGSYIVATSKVGKDVGDYEITLRLTDTDKYRWADTNDNVAYKVVTFSITKATNVWTTTPAVTGTDYTGNAMETAGAAEFGEKTITYYVQDADGNKTGSALDTAPVNVGKYIAVFTVEETDNYTELSTEVKFEITRADMTYTAPQANTLTYNTTGNQALVTAGEVTTPVSDATIYYYVSKTDTAPVENEQGTNSVPTGTEAGTYYVWYRITDGGNYKPIGWTKVAAATESGEAGKVVINKADLDSNWYTAPTKNDTTYDGTSKTLVNEGEVKTGGGIPTITIKYHLYDSENDSSKAASELDYKTDVPTATDPGTYTVYYEIDDGGNYNTIYGSVNVTIKEPTYYVYHNEYVSGHEMIFVFTNDDAKYTYGDKAMYDITDLGYKLYSYTKDGKTCYSLTANVTIDGQSNTATLVNETGVFTHVYAYLNGNAVEESDIKYVAASTKVAGTITLRDKDPLNVNVSKAVDLYDAVAVQAAANVTESYLTTYLYVMFRADVNKDGVVNVADDAASIKATYLNK